MASIGIVSGSIEKGFVGQLITLAEQSGRPYVSLSLATPEFGPRRIYANLGRAAGQDRDDVFAIIWTPAD